MSLKYPWYRKLLQWFDANQRDMPWRTDSHPYKVWVSEMMLQQTQVDTVRPYFERFMKIFPNVEMLASAGFESVLKCWEGLGYYRRAHYLHKAARVIVQDRRGGFPVLAEEWQQLPGIGPYAAAAIASIAFAEPIPAIDGNVLRVMCRFLGLRSPLKSAKTRQIIDASLLDVMPKVSPAKFNQAMMELGALICRPQQPLCPYCPLSSGCVAWKTNQVQQIPISVTRQRIPQVTVGIACIIDQQHVLIAQREENQMLGGLWEFPGGKKEKRESIRQTVIREVLEETGLEVKLQSKLGIYRQTYSHFKVVLHTYLAFPTSLKNLRTDRNIRWIKWPEKDLYTFPRINHQIFKDLHQVLDG